MEQYSGTLRVYRQHEGTKSEGNYTFLEINDRKYQLFREGVFYMNDSYFYDFTSLKVTVEGELIDDKWIKVQSLKLTINNDEINSKQLCNECGQRIDSNYKFCLVCGIHMQLGAYKVGGEINRSYFTTKTTIKIESDRCCDIYKDKELIVKDLPPRCTVELPLLEMREYFFEIINTEEPCSSVGYIYNVKDLNFREYLFINLDKDIAIPLGKKIEEYINQIENDKSEIRY